MTTYVSITRTHFKQNVDLIVDMSSYLRCEFYIKNVHLAPTHNLCVKEN